MEGGRENGREKEKGEEETVQEEKTNKQERRTCTHKYDPQKYFRKAKWQSALAYTGIFSKLDTRIDSMIDCTAY